MSDAPQDVNGGERPPTMQDVADRVGVSRALVSMVFRGLSGPSENTRRRIVEAAAAIGYQPNTSAQVLRRQRSRQLGVVLTMSNAFEVEIVEEMFAVAAELDHQLVIAPMTPTRHQHTAVQDLLGHRCDALILVGPEADSRELQGVAARLPTVGIGRRMTNTAVDIIRTDDAAGTRLAVEHLYALGHRAITHIDGGRMPGAAERRRGYRSAMRRLHLETGLAVIPGDYSEESGIRAAQQLMSDETLPTAIVAGNDRCAFGVLRTLLENGIAVPGDMSVVGFDDSRLTRLPTFDLTSVHQDAAALASLAVRAAIARVEGDRSAGTDTALPPTLSVGSTTARPRPNSAPMR